MNLWNYESNCYNEIPIVYQKCVCMWGKGGGGKWTWDRKYKKKSKNKLQNHVFCAGILLFGSVTFRSHYYSSYLKKKNSSLFANYYISHSKTYYLLSHKFFYNILFTNYCISLQQDSPPSIPSQLSCPVLSSLYSYLSKKHTVPGLSTQKA